MSCCTSLPTTQVRRSVHWHPPQTDVIEVQRADTDALRDLAYRIRYVAYRDGDYIRPRVEKRFSDEYDLKSNAQIILLFKGDQPAATARLCVHDPEADAPVPLPAMEIFGKEIAAMRGRPEFAGRRPKIIEMNKLARLPEYNRDTSVVFAMFRTGAYFHLHTETDIFLYAVRAHHVPMYRRLGFELLTSPRPYPGLDFTTCLMASFPAGHKALIEGQPFMRGISRYDETCRALIAGERVKIFGTAAPTPAALPRRQLPDAQPAVPLLPQVALLPQTVLLPQHVPA